MAKTFGIVGAGLIGRVMALKLAKAGHDVRLFDKDNYDGHNSCAYAGGGLLTPYTELDCADEIIHQLALESIAGWQEITQLLPAHVYLQHQGCIVVAHQPDLSDMHHLHDKIATHLPVEKQQAIELLDAAKLRELEPELRFQSGLFFPDEGQIDNRQLVNALTSALLACENIIWHASTEVDVVQAHTIISNNGDRHTFDWVIDCRGLGAKQELPLRGVRGEIIRVHAPEVNLNRPIRLIHPRYVIYIIPRENHHFVIGATSLESEDTRQVTVQSALELLSAAFSVHKGFAEAEIMDMSRNWRPALQNNLPQISCEPGLMRINGLYRWGFMLTPALTRLALSILNNQHDIDMSYSSILSIQSLPQSLSGVAA